MKLVLGTANLSKIYSLRQKRIINKKYVIKQIYLSIRKGINFFDTAPSYGNSEKYLGEVNKKIKIITKISIIKKDKIKESMNDSVNLSLKNLNRKYLDYLIIHDIEFFKKNNPKKIYKHLTNLKKKNLCKKIGFSVYTPSDIEFICKFGIPDVLQIPLSIFNRSFEKLRILKILKKKGVEIHARSIFMKGFLLMDNSELPNYLKKYKKLHLNFQNWCNRHQVSQLEACINYIRNNTYVSKIIIGIDNVEELKEIIKFFNKNKKIFPKKIHSNDNNLIDIRKWKK